MGAGAQTAALYIMLPVSIVYEKLLAKDCVLVDVLGVYSQVPGRMPMLYDFMQLLERPRCVPDYKSSFELSSLLRGNQLCETGANVLFLISLPASPKRSNGVLHTLGFGIDL